MQKIKLGIIGCGGMTTNGGHVVGLNLLAEEGQLEVSSVCDINPKSLENAKNLLHAPHATTDWREMADHVDAVLVSLPHDLHYECGMFFAERGKHVLMEKPLCNTEEECVNLIEEAKKQNITLMCAYPVPYWPEVLKLKELVDTGEYGRIISMSIWTEQYTKFPDKYHWAHTGRLGGGQLFSHGCHYIDTLLRFLGEPVTGAHLGTRIGTEWLLKEGTSHVILKFANGALGYHGATWGARGTKQGNSMQIQTEKGMLEYNRNTEQVLFHVGRTEEILSSEYQDEKKKKAVTVIMDGKDRKPGLKRAELEIGHFLDCIRTGKKPYTNGEASLQSLRIIWALYEAEKRGVMADLRGLGIPDSDELRRNLVF
ncbi:MAG: Gfo/Idh/MocA family oxidoreductase [Clostridia bacterium]|nr:Gfo/Idh/MocA family oxidoreductase [Clostridia bacterium]